MNKLDMIISLAQPVRDEIKMGMFSTFQGTPQELEESDEAYSLVGLGQAEDSHLLYETEYGTPWITNITDEEAEYIKQHITDIPLTSDDVQELWEITMKYDNCIPYVFTNAQREFIKKICEAEDYIYSSILPFFHNFLDLDNFDIKTAIIHGFHDFEWRDCNHNIYPLDMRHIILRKFLAEHDYKFIPIGFCSDYDMHQQFYEFEYFLEYASKLINFSEDDYKIISEMFTSIKGIFGEPPSPRSIYDMVEDCIDEAGSIEAWIDDKLKHSQPLSLDELKKSFEEQNWSIEPM